jgi:hypothetical protein
MFFEHKELWYQDYDISKDLHFLSHADSLVRISCESEDIVNICGDKNPFFHWPVAKVMSIKRKHTPERRRKRGLVNFWSSLIIVMISLTFRTSCHNIKLANTMVFFNEH